MLSKKYYKAFAELIGAAKDLNEFTANFLRFLKEDNARFDIDRFNEAMNKAYTEKRIKEDLEKEKLELRTTPQFYVSMAQKLEQGKTEKQAVKEVEEETEQK